MEEFNNLDLTNKKVFGVEKRLENYYQFLLIENELDFILKGCYFLQEDLDNVLEGIYG